MTAVILQQWLKVDRKLTSSVFITLMTKSLKQLQPPPGAQPPAETFPAPTGAFRGMDSSCCSCWFSAALIPEATAE